MSDLLLPPGARLLHIGPHKTGTTAIQGALAAARSSLPEHGVVYPGSQRQHALAARSATGRSGPKGDRAPTADDWTRLVDEVRAAGAQRVVISSESFTMADGAIARSVVDQLGGESVHVLVTLRPLSKLMPSSWQQYVREGLAARYGTWLKGMLLEPPYDSPTPSFWHRNRHDQLIDRWAGVVGPDRVTVIVLDSSRPDMLLDTVAAMVGLPSGFLVPEPGRLNRSLTYAEIELVRRLNLEFREHDWSPEMFRKYIRQGVIARLQRTHVPGPEEQQIPTPRWALERAAEIGAEAAEKIGALGVRVVGNLGDLADGADGSSAPEKIPPVPGLPVEVAVEALVGVLETRERHRAEPRPVTAVSTKELSSMVLRRATGSVRRRLRPGSASQGEETAG